MNKENIKALLAGRLENIIIAELVHNYGEAITYEGLQYTIRALEGHRSTVSWWVNVWRQRCKLLEKRSKKI